MEQNSPMKFTCEFEKLRSEIKTTAAEVAEASGLPEDLISRFLIHGIFIAGAHCMEVHGIELPINPKELLTEALGEEAATKMISKVTGGESVWTVGSTEEPSAVIIIGHQGGWEDKS
jgi:hypothetical protein